MSFHKTTVIQHSLMAPSTLWCIRQTEVFPEVILLLWTRSVHIMLLLLGRRPHFSCFTENYSSPMHRHKFRSQVLYYSAPDASIRHTQIQGSSPLWGWSALTLFVCFFDKSFPLFCALAHRLHGVIFKHSVRARRWWPRKAVHAPWHFSRGPRGG